MRRVLGIYISIIVGLMLWSGFTSASDLKSRTLEATDLQCLALNIYFEARGEPMLGKIAVGHVVLNRVSDSRYPQQICSVIRQGGEKRLHRCQFSWWCDGRSDQPRDLRAWNESKLVAWLIKRGATIDPTNGALWYHATTVSPVWARSMNREKMIGKHIFYTERRSDETTTASNADKGEPDA